MTTILFFLILILLNAVFCLGLYNSAQKGKILHGVKDRLKYILPGWLMKPLIGCLPCMASIHGIWFFTLLWVFFGIDVWNLKHHYLYGLLWLPLHIVAVSGLNALSEITLLLSNKVLFLCELQIINNAQQPNNNKESRSTHNSQRL